MVVTDVIIVEVAAAAIAVTGVMQAVRIWTHGMIIGTAKAVEVETTVVVAADKTMVAVVADKTTVAAVITTVATVVDKTTVAVVDKTTVAVATTNMKATGRSFDRLFAFYY